MLIFVHMNCYIITHIYTFDKIDSSNVKCELYIFRCALLYVYFVIGLIEAKKKSVYEVDIYFNFNFSFNYF